ncbi:MAG: tRNA epoxyqueuosine(34) reductase QueG [Flavobacteriales bacterium]|nr:tRNA epoxyqueuosine(34) reductase QueG [Flavobacteriales bacterium]
MVDKNNYSSLIKNEAKRLGFDYVGISKADFLESEAANLESFLKNGYQGDMNYLENHFDKRLDPRLLVPGAKSVVSLLYNYYPLNQQKYSDAPKISKYAYGQDYHDIIKSKLRELMDFIHEEIGEVDGRVFTDSAPVLEKAWAKSSGLGWVGKNGLLITDKRGSFQFISELIIDLELEPDGATTDHCGNCTACMDACPTDAIESPRVVNGSKCISYLTIELKNEIPVEFKNKMENWVFGCDICQDVCPWNKFSTQHSEPLFNAQGGMLDFTKEDWNEMTEDVFRTVFKKSPVKRTKYAGLTRNLVFVRNK